MYAPLISIVLFGLLILSSIVVLIVGIARKKRAVQIAAVVLFFIGVSGCAFSVFAYTRKVVQYVKSPAFQQDAKKGTELIGETLGSAVSGASDGINKGLDEESIRKLAGKSANILGKSTKTFAAGLDSTLWSRSLFQDESMKDSGLEPGSSTEDAPALTINLNFKQNFNGRLFVTKYDLNGKIIERVETDVKGKKGDNKVIRFAFNHSSSRLNSYYIIGRKQP
jgi:hypothetical protein